MLFIHTLEEEEHKTRVNIHAQIEPCKQKKKDGERKKGRKMKDVNQVKESH